ncbi:MAG: NYN domain-containing protein [Candidatus Omnitrophica bacterium]|nr:NYN domain-containing protein [Candidatus Omnitrophota bacterium]
MSLHYLLDGYNIIHQMPVSARSKLEDQRRQLVQWIESCRPQGSPRNAVTVVFDGRLDVWSAAAGTSSVRIVFAQGESADDKIVRTVEEAAHRKNVVVVTDDRALQRGVRALGAKVSSVADFAGKGRPARESSGGQPRKPEAGKNISKTLEYKITSELAKVWLDKEKRGK